jgi:hypothetical protein
VILKYIFTDKNVFLHLKFSPSLNLNKIEHFSKNSFYNRKLNLKEKKEEEIAKNKDQETCFQPEWLKNGHLFSA